MDPLSRLFLDLGAQVLYAGQARDLPVQDEIKALQELVELIGQGHAGLRDAEAAGDQTAIQQLRVAVTELESQRNAHLVKIGQAAYSMRRGSLTTLAQIEKALLAPPTAITTGKRPWKLVFGVGVTVLGVLGFLVFSLGLLGSRDQSAAQNLSRDVANISPASGKESSPRRPAASPVASQFSSEELEEYDIPPELPDEMKAQLIAAKKKLAEEPEDLIRFLPTESVRVDLQEGLHAAVLQESTMPEADRRQLGRTPFSLQAIRDDQVLTMTGPHGKIWNIRNGTLVKAFEIQGQFWGMVRVAISRDGKSLAAVRTYYDKDKGKTGICVYDVASGQLRWKLDGDNESLPIHAGPFLSPDGSRLAITSMEERNIRLWDVMSGKKIATLDTLGRMILDCRLGQDCPLLVTLRDDRKTWELFEWQTGQLKHAWASGDIRAVSSDGTFLVARDQLKLSGWDLSGAIPRAAWMASGIRSHVMFPDQGLFYATGAGDRSEIYDLKTGLVRDRWPSERRSLISPQSDITPDGRLIVGEQVLFDVQTGTPLAALPLHDADYRPQQRLQTLVTSSGKIVTIQNGGRVCLWDPTQLLTDVSLIKARRIWKSPSPFETGVVVSQQGQQISLINVHGVMQLYDVATAQPLPQLAGLGCNAPFPQFINGDLAMVGNLKYLNGAHSMQRWAISSSAGLINTLKQVMKPQEAETFEAISADGSTIASRLGEISNGKLRFTKATTGELISVLDWPSQTLPQASFSHSGETFGLSRFHQFFVFDVAAGKLVKQLDFLPEGEESKVTSAATLAPDGKTVWRHLHPAGNKFADVLYDDLYTSTEVWDVGSGQRQQTFFLGFPVGELIWLADGESVAILSPKELFGFGHAVRICNRQTGRMTAVLVGHSSLITSASYSPKANLLVTSSQDQTIRFWDLNQPSTWTSPAAEEPVLIAQSSNTNSIPGLPGNPARNFSGGSALPGNAPPAMKAELSAEQIATQKELLAKFPKDTLLRGEWSYAKFNGRIILKITENSSAESRLTAEAFEPGKTRDSKLFTGQFEFDQETKTWYLQWSGSADSGIRRTPNRIPVTANLLLLGDTRVIRLREVNGEWRGQDSVSVNYEFKMVEPAKPD